MSNYNVLYDGQRGGQLAQPAYCDTTDHIVPHVRFDKREVWPSKMFTIKLELEEFKKKVPDVPVYDASQGDGGFSLGGIPPQELSEALIRFLPSECSTKYGDPTGRVDIRRAIFENYYGFSAETGLTPDSIVMGDGGRDLLQKWYQVVMQTTKATGGNIVVSAAPWGSYTQGPYINCLNIMLAPGSADNAFKLTPAAVDSCLERSKADGREVVGLVITSPDNPTGNYMQPDDVDALIEHACERGVPHIFVDVIYQAVTDPEVGLYDLNGIFQRLTPEARERVCFMDGLTKSAGASNLRNAHLVVGSALNVQLLKGIATHTVFPNAIGEAAALEVYGQDDPVSHPWIRRVIEPTAQSRKLVQQRFSELGYKFIADQGYYAFVNIWPFLGKRMPGGKRVATAAGEVERIESVAVLKSYLTRHCGLAIIHGTVFKQPEFIRFSYANTPEYTNLAIARLHESLEALED